MDSTFESWLDQRVDAQSLTKELREALRLQFEREQAAAMPPSEVLVIRDDIDQWGKAIRLPVCEVGA